MPIQFETTSIVKVLETMLLETFEETQDQPIYLDRGTAFFQSIEEITAQQASQPMGNCATIAAHVEHVRYYLDVLEDYMFKTALSYVNWKEVWETVSTVSDDEWHEMKTNLKSTYERIKGHLHGAETWDGELELSAMMGIIVHSAYHLGEIRQMMCRLQSEN